MHPPVAATGNCRNCGSPAPQRFCPACGQTTAVHPPTVFEFLHEFVGHYIALEGALWHTLKALLLRPGQLTADYFAGRRGRYIAPLRLYLTFSVILFAVVGWTGSGLRLGSENFRFSAQTPEERAAITTEPNLVIGPSKPQMSTGVAAVDARLKKIGEMSMPEREARIREGVQKYLPYALILLVPVLALLLKLVYYPRHLRYAEHLVFAFHAQTVIFVFSLVSYIPMWDWLGNLLTAALLTHGGMALRRVYGGRIWVTVLREFSLIATYGLIVSLTLVLLVLLSLVF